MDVQTPVQIEPAARQWPPPQGKWTFEDYARLPNDGWRYEVIEGVLFMSPSPSPKHQEAITNFGFSLARFVKANRLGKVFFAPIDVRLPVLADPVQPDILFIRQDRLDIIKEKWIEGAPDLIVEILSPGNWIDDRQTKYRVYALAGVREYWIVDVDRKQIEVYALRSGDYEILGRYNPGQKAPSEVLAGFQIGVDEVCSV
jgi:Uma2 family endonuclease